MNNLDIKRVIAKIQPDHQMEYRLAQKLQQKPQKRITSKTVAVLAAGLAVVVFSSVLADQIFFHKENENTEIVSQNPGVTIPKFGLPENGDASAKMMGLIVYQGKVYLNSATTITPENAEKLLDEKLGTTRGDITEWSKQDDYAVEFASTVGVQDVYSVKGYDKSFRIMSYQKINGVAYTQLFECLNGITVKTGKDIFEKLKLENNIEAAKYEDLDSWNNAKQNYKSLAKLEELNVFLNALDTSIPYSQESLLAIWDDQSADSQKFVTIALMDGTEVQLRLFKDGYVFYNYTSLFFKVEENIFNSFWISLE